MGAPKASRHAPFVAPPSQDEADRIYSQFRLAYYHEDRKDRNARTGEVASFIKLVSRTVCLMASNWQAMHKHGSALTCCNWGHVRSSSSMDVQVATYVQARALRHTETSQLFMCRYRRYPIHSSKHRGGQK